MHKFVFNKTIRLFALNFYDYYSLLIYTPSLTITSQKFRTCNLIVKYKYNRQIIASNNNNIFS